MSELLARATAALGSGHSGQHCLPLLPLLEYPRLKGVEEIVEGASKCAAFRDRADTLASSVVAFALSEASQYWVGLALAWLEDGFPISPEIRAELLSVTGRKSLPQAQRHAAWRLHHSHG